MNSPSVSNVQWPEWMVKAVKEKGYIEVMSEHSTPRQCGDCIAAYQSKPATHWKFKSNKQGGKNQSSRRPVCEAHAK